MAGKKHKNEGHWKGSFKGLSKFHSAHNNLTRVVKGMLWLVTRTHL